MKLKLFALRWIGIVLLYAPLWAQNTSSPTQKRPLTLPSFRTAAWQTKVMYADSSQTQRLSAEIRIQKDSVIWVSLRFLGLTMAKALLTPREVAYVDKYNGQYYKGGYAFLHHWLGVDLDFQKVQALLLGRLMTDLPEGEWCSGVGGPCRVEWPFNQAFLSAEWDTSNGCLARQQLRKPDVQQQFSAQYPSWVPSALGLQPQQWMIEARQPGQWSRIELEYDTINWNEPLGFPFSIPEDYTPITID